MPETTNLYRVENPTIPANPNGIVSHEDLVGQWFAPDIDTATDYLRKSTQTFGRDSQVIDGAQLVIAEVLTEDLDKYHVTRNPTSAKMDVESNNYVLPRDGSIAMREVPLDEIIDDLRGNLGNFLKLAEAKRRIVALIAIQSLK